MRGILLAMALLAILAAAALFLNIPLTPHERPEQIRMATTWLVNSERENLPEIISQMNETGANTIAIGVHDRGVLYFETDSIDIRTINIVPTIIEEARRNDLKVFLWTDTLNFPELIEEHPEWEFVTCVRSGRYHYPSDCGWHDRLSPFNPGIEDFIKEYYKDIASLDIDGIQFQDDLFLAEGEDWSDAAMYAFLDHYGYPPDPRDIEDTQRMQELKVAKITELTRLAIDSAREVNPNITFIFDVLPEPRADRMLSWWSIDIQALKQAGVDYFGIMSYHPQIMEDMRTDLEGSMDYLNSAFRSISGQVGEDQVIYRLWTVSWDESRTPLPPEEIGYVLERMHEAGAYHTGYVPHHQDVPDYGIFPSQ